MEIKPTKFMGFYAVFMPPRIPLANPRQKILFNTGGNKKEHR